jgi:hypothetical protein
MSKTLLANRSSFFGKQPPKSAKKQYQKYPAVDEDRVELEKNFSKLTVHLLFLPSRPFQKHRFLPEAFSTIDILINNAERAWLILAKMV